MPLLTRSRVLLTFAEHLHGSSLYTETSIARDRAVGDAKRRKAKMGESYGNPDDDRIVEWLPLTHGQARRMNEITTQGAWFGIGILVVYWIIIRLVGPALGLWEIGLLD